MDEIKELFKYIDSSHYLRIIQIVIQCEELQDSINCTTGSVQIGPISDHDDGIRIDLNKLKPETIKQLHAFIENKTKE